MFRIGRIIFLEIAILLKAIYSFHVIPIKFPMLFFTKIDKSILILIWKQKRPKIATVILNKRILLKVSQHLVSKYEP
jgi:hypothetical protein